MACPPCFRVGKFYERPFMKPVFIAETVEIGGLPLGGLHPVRIQSMTNTPTKDTLSTVRQVERLVQAGCEMVRITARNIAEAKNLKAIRDELHGRGVRVPLIADIHFNPEAALVAAQIVDKVRINPGNYVDRPTNSSAQQTWTEAGYRQELERISERLDPLVRLCKAEGTAIRVGTNHGSLSRRVLDRFGNTAEGMVESAMEFVRILHGMDFSKLVLSMKSSDIRVMQRSYRLLVERMQMEGFSYPLHLGVTEAGAGDDGIIKSACGMGPLLAYGIGDTLRVSLTGDPESEIPAAKALVDLYRESKNRLSEPADATHMEDTMPAGRPALLSATSVLPGSEDLSLTAPEVISALRDVTKESAESLQCIKDDPGAGRLVVDAMDPASRLVFDQIRGARFSGRRVVRVTVLTQNPLTTRVVWACRAAEFLERGGVDYLWLEGPDAEEAYQTGLDILQAWGFRRSKAEFVSCPSCGRTEFDIEKVLQQVKQATSHLTKLKIAVMGCVVNGPGEMLGADYGCVGMGKGQVVLYKAGEMMQGHVPEQEAAAALCRLIRESGDWTDQKSVVSDK